MGERNTVVITVKLNGRWRSNVLELRGKMMCDSKVRDRE